MPEEAVEYIIKDLMKRCDTDPESVLQFLINVGHKIGTLYQIDMHTKNLEEELKRLDVDSYVIFYLEQYKRKPTKTEIEEYLDSVKAEIAYDEERLISYLNAGHVFFDTGIKNEYITGDYDDYGKIFTKQQIKLIYRAVQEYIVNNQKFIVLKTKNRFGENCVDCFEEKYKDAIKNFLINKCSVKDLLGGYADKNKINDIDLANKITNEVLEKGKVKDYLEVFIKLINSDFRSASDRKQNDINCQKLADAILENAIETSNKKLCKQLIFATNENGKSDEKMRSVKKYIDSEKLIKAYISMCSKKELQDFVDEIASNKSASDYRSTPWQDEVELC